MKTTSRQTILLLAVVVIGGTAFAAWQFVLIPLEERDANLKRVREEYDKKALERDEIVLDLKLHERAQQQMSLPADASFAVNEYGKLLESLLAHSKLQKRDVKPGQIETRNVPLLPNKKPAYARVSYNLQLRGDLFSLIEFMYGLYRQPLLHQIRKLNIQVPQGGATVRGMRTDELDVTMTIEMLIIDKAEKRPTLIAMPASMGLIAATPPSMGFVAGGMGCTAWSAHSFRDPNYVSPFHADDFLARADGDTAPSAGKKPEPWKMTPTAAEYLRIAGKNIFTGPTPTATKEGPPPVAPEKDFAPFIKLNEITTDSEGNSQASLRNLMLKYDYTVTQSPTGDVSVKVYYFINKTVGEHTVSTKKPYDSNNKGILSFGSEAKGNYREFAILKLVDTTDVLLQRIDEHKAHEKLNAVRAMMLGGTAPILYPGEVYRWHIGQALSEAVEGKMGEVPDMNGDEQPTFIPAEPLSPPVAQAAMITGGKFPDNVKPAKRRPGGRGWPSKDGGPPKKDGWGDPFGGP